MSKSETLKHLDDTSPALALLEAVLRLEHQIQELPPALGSAAQGQVQTLAEIVGRMDSRAASQAQAAEKLASQLANLEQAVRVRQAELQKILREGAKIATEVKTTAKAARRAMEQVQEDQPTWWFAPALAALAAILAAVFTVGLQMMAFGLIG